MVTTGTKLADRYLVGDKIATGGMGAIFEATDERLGRRVVVKLLKDDLAQDQRFVERFRREARAAAALSHPNVAAVFDYGEDDSCNFIVMELADGKDLARLLREEGPLSEERAARITAQVCHALGHAHAAGLVHRDIKPANIIVGAGDRVKVTDFGIARAAGDSTLTATGSVLGTAHYLSPEQASGERVTAASDLYSLGIVLYEMLTGALPFTGETAIAVAMRHVSEDVPPPSELNPNVSLTMDSVVARATARSSHERFNSAHEMAAALEGTMDETDPAATAVLAGDRPTEPLGDRPLAFPTRYDPYKLGKVVLITLGTLVAVAAALLIVRLAAGAGDEETAGGETTGRRRQQQSPAPAGYVIPNEILEMNVKEAKELLEAHDLVVTDQKIPHDEPKDEVVASEPEPGTEVQPGDPVTLLVSEGPKEEEDDEDDDDGPGRGNGPPPGKGKGKSDD